MDLHETAEHQPLRSLWAAHLDEPFPSEVDGSEDTAGDLVRLDADIAGVISTVLGSRRPPNVGEQFILRACLEVLDRLDISTPAQSYFDRLRKMANLALASTGPRR